MKTVILSVLALCITVPAMADIVFTGTAASSAACKTAAEKNAVRIFLGSNRADQPAPACYKPMTVKTYAAVNNCKTSSEKNALRIYLGSNRANQPAPACYSAAKWVGHAKNSSACKTPMEKFNMRRYLAGRPGAKAPACYK